MEANRLSLAQSLSPRDDMEDFLEDVYRPVRSLPSSATIDLAYASIMSPTDALQVASRVNELEHDMEEIKVGEQVADNILRGLSDMVTPSTRGQLVEHLRGLKRASWHSWDYSRWDYSHVRDSLLPFHTRLALRGYGLGAKHSVDRAFYDIIGARREGIEFLEFRRWLMKLMDDMEDANNTRRPTTTSSYGESAVPAEMRDRVRSAFVKREGLHGTISPSTRSAMREAINSVSLVRPEDPMALLFHSLDLGNSQVDDFRSWIEDVFVDYELLPKAPHSGTSHRGDADKQWHNLKQPLFQTGSTSFSKPKERPASPPRVAETYKDDAAAWGEPWRPKPESALERDRPSALMNAMVASEIVGRASSPLRHSFLTPVVLRSASPERVVVRHSSPSRFGDKMHQSYHDDALDADSSHWKRRMAANRKELRELAEELPTRVISSMGPNLVINEDPLGLTTVMVDHPEARWGRYGVF